MNDGHLPVPPDDPEAWTDEQWIAYLEIVELLADDPPEPLTPAKVHPNDTGRNLVVRLAGAGMIGAYEAIYGVQEDKIEVVAEEGEPHDPDLLVDLVPDHPEQSTVHLKGRWAEGR
jgi:hypothetical protein